MPTKGDLLWQEQPVTTDRVQILDRWHVQWSGGKPRLTELPWSGDRGSTVVLAMLGNAPRAEPDDAATVLVEAVEKATLDLQNQGVQVSGLHLDLSGAGDTASSFDGAATVNLEWLAALYRAVRRELSDGLELSATLLGHSRLQLEAEVKSVTGALDWTLVQLYGQRYGAPDDAAMWDLEAALDRQRIVSASETPSRGLVHLSGSLKRLHNGSSSPLSEWLGCDLLSELGRRADAVFQFEGYFRQVFEADSRERVLTIGDTTLPLSGTVQVTRTTPDHLRKLRLGVEEIGDVNFLGLTYRNMSTDSNNCLTIDQSRLDLSRADLLSTPSAVVEPISSGRFQLTLTAGSEPTALGRKLYNYVDVITDTGVVDRVDMRGFARFEFLDASLEPVPGLGGRGVRLFLPMLEPGTQALATFRVRGQRTIEAIPVFRSATGDPLVSETTLWPAPANEELGT